MDKKTLDNLYVDLSEGSEMKEKLIGMTLRLTESAHERLKLLALSEKASMREVVVKALEYYAEMPRHKTALKNMNHKMYRLKHDKSDGR